MNALPARWSYLLAMVPSIRMLLLQNGCSRRIPMRRELEQMLRSLGYWLEVRDILDVALAFFSRLKYRFYLHPNRYGVWIDFSQSMN